MNILKSLTSNKHILNVALGQITGSMERDNITAIVIIRDPENKSEDSPGLDIRSFNGKIGVLTGGDLDEYERYIQARNFTAAAGYDPGDAKEVSIARDYMDSKKPVGEKEAGDVHGD